MLGGAAVKDERGIPLLLTREGAGSRAEIEAYVASVIRERTTPNEGTSAERLAYAITTSVLHRLGASFSVATGNPEAEALYVYSGTMSPPSTRTVAIAEAVRVAAAGSDFTISPESMAAHAAMARALIASIAALLPVLPGRDEA